MVRSTSSRARRRFALCLVASSLACAHAPDRVRFADPEVEGLAAKLEELRQLHFLQPVKVIPMSDAKFADTFGQDARPMAALYLPQGNLIAIRSRLRGATRDEVLVHELTHALQYQNFERLRHAGATPDADLALTALKEGDATLSEALWLQAAAAEKHSDAVARLAQSGLLSSSNNASDWNVSQLADDFSTSGLILLVHRIGPQFMATLYAHGGLALVSRALADPPVTTAELLHPERYIRGEKALEVAVPSSLEGKGMGRFAPLGELRLRSLLDHCIARDDAIALAAESHGDALSLARAARNELFTLRWITVWRSLGAAKRFEETARQQVGCLAHALAGPGAEDAPVQDIWVIRREGRTVFVDQGPIQEVEIQKMLALVPGEFRAESIPGEVVASASVSSAEVLEAWKVSPSGTYVNDQLGLTVPIPEGFKVTVRDDEQLGMQSAELPVSTLVIRFRRSFWNEQPEDVANEAALAAVTRLQGNFHADGKGWNGFAGPLGLGIEERYRLREAPQVRLRVVVISSCDKKGFDVVTQIWSRDADGKKLEALAHAIEVKAQRPVCDD